MRKGSQEGNPEKRDTRDRNCVRRLEVLMKKILVVTLASLALALNFGLASAHPFGEPTPPANPTPTVDNTATSATETDVEQEGDNQTGATDASQTDVAETNDETDMKDADDENDNEDDEDKTGNAPAATTTTNIANAIANAIASQQGAHEKQDRHNEKVGESKDDD
jgi:hypothetical protein